MPSSEENLASYQKFVDVCRMALVISLQAPIPFFHPTLVHFLTLKLTPKSTKPSLDRHNQIDHRPETGEEVRYVTDFTISLLLSSMVALFPVSVFGLPSTALRVSRPASMVGGKFGVTLRRGKIKLGPQRCQSRLVTWLPSISQQRGFRFLQIRSKVS